MLGSMPASRASFTSESTWALSHWATSSGPRSPAASTAKRWPSTTRTPTATGSTPRRTQARSRNDSAGSTSTSTRCVGEEQLDGVLGHERRAGHGVEHARRARRRRPPGARRSPGRPRRSSRRPRRRRRRWWRRPRPRPPDGGWCAGSARGAASIAASVPAVSRSVPPGPRPTITTRGRSAMVRPLLGGQPRQRIDGGGGGRRLLGAGRDGDLAGGLVEAAEAAVDGDGGVLGDAGQLGGEQLLRVGRDLAAIWAFTSSKVSTPRERTRMRW